MGRWWKRQRLDLDDDDFKAEVETHLAMAEAERVAEGADRDTAHYAALKDFGNVTLTTEAARRVWTPGWLEAVRDLTSDLRYAVRSLLRHKAFAVTVVGVLALGIGVNAAVFTMLKSIALTPLAGVAGSASLRVVHGETSTGRDLALSYPDYLQLREHDRAFAELFGSALATITLGRGRGARPVSGELVTGNYFHVLGVGAQRGRVLQPSDEVAPGRHPVVVLSDRLWRTDFGANPDIVGTTVEINNVPLSVVGIADASFHGTIVSYDVEVFIPVMTAPELGFTFGSRHTTPAGDSRRSHRGGLLPARLPASRRDAGDGGRRGRRGAVGHPGPRSAGGRTRAAAARRAVLAVSGQRPDLHPADARRAERDGHPGPADRLRQHRRAGAGPRRVTARRDRRTAGPRGDPRAHRAAARPRESRARPARAPCWGWCSPGKGFRRCSTTPSGWPPRSACSSTSSSTAWSSPSPWWRPASAPSSSAWSPPCRARGSTWCRSSTRTLRHAARRVAGCAPPSSSPRWRSRSCSWSAPVWRCVASTRRSAPIRASTRRSSPRSSWTSARTATTPRAAGPSTDSCWRRREPMPASSRRPSPGTFRWHCSTPGRCAWRSTATCRGATRISPSCRTPSAPTTSRPCGSA